MDRVTLEEVLTLAARAEAAGQETLAYGLFTVAGAESPLTVRAPRRHPLFETGDSARNQSSAGLGRFLAGVLILNPAAEPRP